MPRRSRSLTLSCRRALTALLCGLTVMGGIVEGQYPWPGAPAPAPPPPLLHVRVAGPAGLRVTFFRGGRSSQTLEAPFTVGLRPGYIYRVEMSGIPDHPGLVLHPTLEVRGSLWVPPVMARDNPAPLVFYPEDFTAVRSGSLVTRVVTVERPDEATPVATRPDRPLEFTAPLDRDPLEEALRHGRPLMIVRLGQRQLSPAELAAEAIPGTVLLPGERVLPLPAVPPWIPWTCAPVADPKLGPYPPSSEICFYDGGDMGKQAAFNRDGALVGLDPADTVAQYTNSKGQRHVSVSNRVCLCVPRYVVTRGETAPQVNLAQVGPFQATVAAGYSGIRSWWTTLEYDQRHYLVQLGSRVRPSETVQIIGAAIIGRYEGSSVVSTAVETGAVTSSCPHPEVVRPDKPLLLIKWPDRCATQIGEVVTFFLKYTNQGGQPITDVIVSDSLTARLEYVPGSSRSDRDSVFTTQPNEVGSLILRWEINGALPPGQNGVVSFQARIR